MLLTLGPSRWLIPQPKVTSLLKVAPSHDVFLLSSDYFLQHLSSSDLKRVTIPLLLTLEYYAVPCGFPIPAYIF